MPISVLRRIALIASAISLSLHGCDVLFLYTVVSAAVLGFLVAGERRGLKLASNLLLILYTVAFVLIIDLDRPQAGTVKVPQRALEELARTLDADSAREPSRPRPPGPKN